MLSVRLFKIHDNVRGSHYKREVSGSGSVVVNLQSRPGINSVTDATNPSELLLD